MFFGVYKQLVAKQITPNWEPAKCEGKQTQQALWELNHYIILNVFLA